VAGVAQDPIAWLMRTAPCPQVRAEMAAPLSWRCPDDH
jgi:hypothetical protein